MPPELNIRISKSVLSILAFAMQHRQEYSQGDRDLMDNCGPFLSPAIWDALKEIREFPFEIASKIYPILYHQYFNTDGAAIDFIQLHTRLEQEHTEWNVEQLQELLTDGERMMSALLFRNRFLTAIRAFI